MKYLILLFLVLPIIGCKESKNGGGVITYTEQPAGPTTPPPFTGPFGGPIANDEDIPDPSEYLSDYNSFDLEAMIFAAPSGGIIELDRNVILNATASINKPIKIRSAAGKRVKIIGRNLSNLFSTDFNNIEFSNIDFTLYNSQSFLVNGQMLGTGLTLENITVELLGGSSMKIRMNGVNLRNSTILGYSNLVDADRSLVSLSGGNHNLVGNNIIDTKDTFGKGIYLDEVYNSVIRSNVIRCHCLLLGAPIRTFILNDSVISGNILHDANHGRLANGGIFADPDLDGSFGLALQYAHDITDQGVANKYNADRFAITDEYVPNDPNISSGLDFIQNVSITAFGNNQLFNYPSTKDWTPVCALGTNPSISLNAVSGWNSYSTVGGLTIYYAGSIRPACL